MGVDVWDKVLNSAGIRHSLLEAIPAKTLSLLFRGQINRFMLY